MTAGPAVSQLVAQFEEVSVIRDVSKQNKHHEQTSGYQKDFLDKVKNLTSTLGEMGNPFEEETKDLLKLDSKDIASPHNAERTASHLSSGAKGFEAV